MKQNYQQWIDLHYPTTASARNKCRDAVVDMTRKFPELIIQVGRANGIFHCWLKTSSDIIIDPTAKQFDTFDISYDVIADRLLDKDEYEPATGAIFLNPR